MSEKLPKLNFKQMKQRCLADVGDFALPGFEAHNTDDGVYYYQDNGADLLAVAHLDSVQDTNHFWVTTLGGRQVVFNAQLDDRLGAYLILDYVPSIIGQGKYDILLTEGEEHCQSTAYWFETAKHYKWMFQFDRGGVDCVLYQYQNHKLKALLEAANWHVGIGSYSDTCELGHLGCAGINFGAGYEDYHSDMSHAFASDIYYNVKRFVRFYRKNHNQVLPVPGGKLQYRRWSNYEVDDYDYSKRDYSTAQLLDQHGDPVRPQDEIDVDDLEMCSGCNGWFKAEDLMWVGNDGYCRDCVDATEDRYTKRGRDKYALEFQSKPGRTCPRCFNFCTDGYCTYCDAEV